MPHTILPGERAGPYVPDYRTLFTHSPDAFIVSDTGTRIRAANAAAELLFSSPGTALLHKPLTSFVRRGERTSFRQRLKRLMNYQAIEDWEVTFSSPGQRPFTAAMTVKVLPGGKPSRILWSIRNITERKMTEIRMNDQNGNFRRIHESLPDIVYTTDRYDRITFITGAVGRLLGIPAEEFMGKNILCLIGILNNSPRIRAIESCCARGGDTVEHTVQMEIDGRLGMFELKEQSAPILPAPSPASPVSCGIVPGAWFRRTIAPWWRRPPSVWLSFRICLSVSFLRAASLQQ